MQINSLWPSDAIRRQRSVLNLVCCLTKPLWTRIELSSKVFRGIHLRATLSAHVLNPYLEIHFWNHYYISQGQMGPNIWAWWIRYTNETAYRESTRYQMGNIIAWSCWSRGVAWILVQMALLSTFLVFLPVYIASSCFDISKVNREQNWSLGLGRSKEVTWQSAAIDDPYKAFKCRARIHVYGNGIYLHKRTTQ